MDISDLYNDRVDIYTEAELDAVGVYSGGTTIASANVPCLLQALTEEQLTTVIGGFDRTRILMLSDTDSNLESGRKVVIQKNVAYGTGQVCYIESSPIVRAAPPGLASAHHVETILVVER